MITARLQPYRFNAARLLRPLLRSYIVEPSPIAGREIDEGGSAIREESLVVDI